ncbi:peptidylprolyl isomerase [Synoicihabitans lomoniglobus]|uniref:peptidylprolyl isomerase n=1 Tax=Synoicihabitans lomoniglobus TaxID=2909285 RepID=A0AAE9ZRB5_9BACT|nr:peptidylprolyl isomerase [Opitutaceae bacterium LMO-M01]WED63810.1 peptidylprolyl isomerase [Opitutaceae bacterium LMO-M01]
MIRALRSTFLLLGVFTLTTTRAELPDGLYAVISTSRGELTARLDFETAPLTVTSFVGLAEGTLGPAPGHPFFDGLTFHRVVPGFVIQGGDPLGTGEGGPGYEFPDEFRPELRHDRVGTLSMANEGPDTNGSQFFITLTELNRLNYLHSVFGEVIAGLDVLPRIAAGDEMTVRIRRIGPAAQAFVADRTTFADRQRRAPPLRVSFFETAPGILPTNWTWDITLRQKLENLHRFTGARLYVRLHATSPADWRPHDTTAIDRFAFRAQLDPDAIVAFYFADSGLWQLKFGSASAARFTSTDDHLPTKIVRLLADCADEADETLVSLYGDEVPVGRHAKVNVDTVIDHLITIIAPQP